MEKGEFSALWPSQEIKQASLAYGTPIDLSQVGETPVNHGIVAIALSDSREVEAVKWIGEY